MLVCSELLMLCPLLNAPYPLALLPLFIGLLGGTRLKHGHDAST